MANLVGRAKIIAERLAAKRAEQVKNEMSGNNFSSTGIGVYGHSEDTAPYVPSAAPLPPGNNFSPKAQKLAKTPASNTVNIQQGQNVAEYLPVTTGAASIVTFLNGRPNVSISLPTQSYTEIANNFIQAIIRGERPSIPTNVVTFSSVTPPRDSSGDRGGTAATVTSPLSNATPNTTTTSFEAGRIRVNGP